MPEVPASIDPTGKRDESASMADFVGSAPDGSTIKGRDGARYRLDQGLRLKGRWGLRFEGNCEVFTNYQAAGPSSPAQTAILNALGIPIDPLRKNFSHISFEGGGDIRGSWRVTGPVKNPGYFFEPLEGQHGVRALGVKGFQWSGRVQNVNGDGVYIGASRTRGASDPTEDWVVEDMTVLGTNRQGVSFTGAEKGKARRLQIGNVARSAFDFEPPARYDIIRDIEVSEFTIVGRIPLNVVAAKGRSRVFQNVTIRDGDLGPKAFRMVFGGGDGGTERFGLHVLRVRATVVLKSSRSPLEVSGIDEVEAVENVMPMQPWRQNPAILLRNQTGRNIHGNVYPGGRMEYEVA